MTPDQLKKYIEIENLSMKIRSLIIDRTITIESVISEILIETLSTEKTKGSIERHLFSNILSFDQRISLFNSFVEHGVFDNTDIDKRLKSNLSYIRKIRNLMAHSMLDTSIEFINVFDGKSIRYNSFTVEGVKDIVIKLGKGNDKPKVNLYFETSIVDKLNVTFDVVQMIYQRLKFPNNTDSSNSS